MAEVLGSHDSARDELNLSGSIGVVAASLNEGLLAPMEMRRHPGSAGKSAPGGAVAAVQARDVADVMGMDDGVMAGEMRTAATAAASQPNA